MFYVVRNKNKRRFLKRKVKNTIVDKIGYIATGLNLNWLEQSWVYFIIFKTENPLLIVDSCVGWLVKRISFIL